MRVSRLYSGLFTVTLLIAAHGSALTQCDRNGDQRITATDALLVLRMGNSVARQLIA